MYDDEDLASIREAREQWESETRDPFLEKGGERKDRFATVSNHEVDDLYTPEDVSDLDYEEDLGFPGESPYTRGVYPTMYRGRTWTMRQFAGFGTATETNERFHYLIENGQTGLSTAFDMPSLMGKDSDDPLSDGEVGKEGVAVDTLRDMEVLFDGIDIGDVTTSFTINPSAPVVFAMYVALADNRGVSRDQIGGTFQNDMLKEFIAQKEWVIPPEPSLKLVTDTVEFAADETPRIRPISVSGYHIREAGSTAIQELAFTLADGFAYVEDAVDRGLDIDEFAPQLSFFFNSHNSIFEEVAKFRAARRIYHHVMTEWYGAEDERSKQLKFHTQTAGQSLTAQQPLNNIVRVTIQALAGVLGGTQSLHTNSFDEALALPSEEAVTVALRTQQIIAEESGAADVIDPLGGSFFIEKLTDEIEDEAMAYIEEIREMGDGSVRDGVLAGIDEGYYHKEIGEASYEYQSRVEKNEEIVVGVNKYATDGDTKPDLLHVEDEVQDRQLERLESVKQERDDEEVEAALDELRETIEAEENVMPVLVDAVKAYATMGEIMDVFEAKYGAYREKIGLA
ncbi:methylmalonyl-CoA mutase [Haloferax mediterranei ATCC 33500]|uniref:Methylmalonyl-CoA mutase n=1 Tax=Haloferax mediterranei (strain ATCC 33500 / DSM 1411 / JCM 8866 / NBRC 14739 / NCIMB 2177 / R-4) TaxID=523841 RepID=I3R2X8_HALMT|nr:methylmalonyl-CoA mutase family protein [Haloferax mediterranei]AFK18588.1 methylmalonyl-CoA mutase, N-terminal domain protein [Haloferax mediterranei ATCC 33500]AHZ22038.1 methylmalonyl-CoA mutase [Haloferax mediterranei ATCC 33500]EMA02137.1 methylmalonyl-CoA mutase, N-terminal domain protein [Haloferax mediterranei ATCC 33500]MDX5988676.1 methylmalonyl-CoA mutase family protein [Haloferax mediterranei ATCC 33500]QCQ75088.1 methylmalonyl-CoA mutase [Haloferax mediterranei ATCC 33500]